MSGPQPPQALEGHCSAIDDDTLYVLSPSGFQSLDLTKNATWNEEASGKAVTGAACVTVDSQRAMYVIGGTSDDANYGGLQRYDFAGKSWETLSLASSIMQSRTDHSAAYLEDSRSILVYAGSQPDAPSDLSSQTFVISTVTPYNVQAFTSEAPPTSLPILTPWNSSHAVMVGGAPTNERVFLFDPSQGWSALHTNLTQPLDATSRGLIVDGSDGSKVLQVYNFNVSPNTISQIVLLDANGQTAAAGQTVGNSSSTRKRRRDLSLSDWPSYNSSNAPTATRADCAVAQGPSGIAAMTGGSTDLPVALFNQNENSWVDVSDFFGSKAQQPLQPSSTPSSTATSTPTASSAPSHTAPADSGNTNGSTAHQRMLRTLGITLGVLCGIAALFILILLFLRWRKQKRRGQEGYIDEKRGTRMSFADRGASFMKEAGGSVNNLLPPDHTKFSAVNGDPHGGSHSSLAIISGKYNKSHPHQKASFDSTAPFAHDKSGAEEPMEMMDIGEKTLAVPSQNRLPQQRPPASTYETEKELAVDDADRSRSSGWSKYFATSGPTGPNGVSHLPVGYMRTQTTSGLSDISDYSKASNLSRIPSSVLVPPLDIDFSKTLDGQRLSRVATGSPVFNHSRDDLARQGSAAELSHGQSGLVIDSPTLDRRSQISGYSLSTNHRTTMGSTMSGSSDFYSHDTPEVPYTPVSFKDHLNNDVRPTSSNYTTSVYNPPMPTRNKGGGSFFPGAGVSYKTSPKTKLSALAAPSAEWASPKPPPALNLSKAAEDRDSSITVFPRGVPSAYYADGRKSVAGGGRGQSEAKSSDMSWLNLGLGSNNKI
ncbi:hypothetical protein LTR62_006099 [Meristemomyces frigidus]|uniref:Pre-mRNA splicing factor CLF1 n=1 Tax=Meristemomyces frigidus TaxID=1508187 RepID=A0AAN7TCZ5_9PEZI|nr:hypothetical protein LTR62_006099 [Meristemomyces frigidus]